MQKKGVLLVNLGTPDSPSVKDVRKYLREFLMDKYVIDLPYLYRWFLVNVIITTFRGPKSAKIYQQLWSEKGSPLLYYGKRVEKLVQEKMGDEYFVRLAMRYQNPSMKKVLQEFKKNNIDNIVVIPMYPQFASSSTLSSIKKVESVLAELKYHPTVKIVENFVSNRKFIQAFAENGNKHWITRKFDKVMFSFHGIPERHILNDCTDGSCKLNEACCKNYTQQNKLCYRAQCYETARLIAAKMGLNESQFDVAFQSRLETRTRDPWLKPYTDIVIADYPKNGIKNVLAFSPSFVSDCLETTIEVGKEFKEIFHANGGENWQLVESLNENPTWIEALQELITN